MEIVVIEDIAAAPDAVWALVGDFAGVLRWHPQLLGCEVAGEGVGLIRTARFADWWIAERLDRIDPVRRKLAYTVVASSRRDAVGSSAEIALLPLKQGASRLRWQARLPAGIDPAQRDPMAAYYRVRVDHLRQALRLAAAAA